MPILEDRCIIDNEHVPGLGPGIEGLIEPVEVLPPELLGLPPVVAGGGGNHGDGPLVVGQRAVLRQGLEVLAQRDFLRAGHNVVDAGKGRLIHPLGARFVWDQAKQPVAQPQRGEAIVFVVVADGFQDPPGLGIVNAQLPGVLGVGDDGGAGVLDIPAAQVLAHVERLELLDRIRALGDQQRVADRVVEIHQQTVAQPLVDDVLGDHMAQRQVPQRALLVGCVVVDLHLREDCAACLDVGDEVGEGLALLGTGVGPEGLEDRFVGVDLDDPEEVFQAPGLVEGILPQRVALEVEEDVTGVGFREPGNGLAGTDLVGNPADGPVAGSEPDLHAGLFGELVVGIARLGVGRGELVNGGDSGFHELPALDGAHAGDQQQVAVFGDLLGAVVAASAGADSLLPPGHRVGCGPVGCGEGLEAGPAVLEHWKQLVHLVHRMGLVPEHQGGVRGDRDSGGDELVAVGGQLEQCGDAGVAGQLGVPHRVGAVGLADEEVGKADEFPVEEGRLEHHVGPLEQRQVGFLVRGHEGSAVAADTRGEHLDAASGGVVVVAELRAQFLEHLVFVGVSQHRGAIQHLVRPEISLGAASQAFVELAQRGEFATCSHHEVGCGVDQILIEEKHGTVLLLPRRSSETSIRPPTIRIWGRMPAGPTTRWPVVDGLVRVQLPADEICRGLGEPGPVFGNGATGAGHLERVIGTLEPDDLAVFI